MKILIKTSLKLLFRTKLLWLFLILMPLLSTFIMKNKVEYSAYIEDEKNMIELGGADEKVSYNGAKGAYAVKVTAFIGACGYGAVFSMSYRLKSRSHRTYIIKMAHPAYCF